MSDLPRRTPERPWTKYVWLVYLTSLIWQPAFDPNTTRIEIGISILSVLVFLPLYWIAFNRSGKKMLPYLAAMALLGLVVSPFNSGALSYLIYAAAGAGFAGPPRLAARIIGVLVLLVGLSILLLRPPLMIGLGLFGLIGLITLAVGWMNISIAERERYNRRLLEAQEENERLATIAERERIARDLHDLLGHTLSVITLKAELAARLAERDPQKAAKEMREVERISREATQQVREAVQGYKSWGLPGELAGAKLALEAANIQFDYLAEAVQLSPAQESVLALALREAITNVIRHSGAQHCTIQLVKDKDTLRLEVKDDGQGGIIRENSGLTGMRQRVEGLGGTLTVESDNGTQLILTLPRNTSALSQDDQPVVPTSFPVTHHP